MANLTNWYYEVCKNGNVSVRFYNSFALARRKAETLADNKNNYVEIWSHVEFIEGKPIHRKSPVLLRYYN